MKNNFTHNNEKLIFDRYPKTDQRSLKAWNAADEYVLDVFKSLDCNKNSVALYNDRFGFLTCFLNSYTPNVVVNYASQKRAILQNLKNNDRSVEKINFIEPFTNSTKIIDVVILKIPKSMELFRLQLIQITKSLDKNGVVLCGFMTKYFSKQILELANEFFESVDQSLAKKKSRVLTLQRPKPQRKENITKSVPFEDKIFRQYFGVFSARHIDYASQFFIKNWRIDKNNAQRILDLASGNGFLAKIIRLQNKESEIYLVDDDWLAVESSKLNFDNNDKNTYFYFSDSIENFADKYFDLIVCNPPFHFEHETNIEVAIDLFKQSKRCLSEQGSFQLVANRHLNYKTHLVKLFGKVRLLKRNKKFEIYECTHK